MAHDPADPPSGVPEPEPASEYVPPTAPRKVRARGRPAQADRTLKTFVVTWRRSLMADAIDEVVTGHGYFIRDGSSNNRVADGRLEIWGDGKPRVWPSGAWVKLEQL
jgi:hypothetical protein